MKVHLLSFLVELWGNLCVMDILSHVGGDILKRILCSLLLILVVLMVNKLISRSPYSYINQWKYKLRRRWLRSF